MAPVSPVSVVVPTYNRARLLQSTLGSLLSQQPRPHVIVVDDGSTDATPAVLERFPVEVVANPAGGWGAGRARNAGLERVTTPLVAFVDSDDLLLPGALVALEAALAQAPSAPFASGGALSARREGGHWIPEGFVTPVPAELDDPLGSLYARNWVPSAGALVRTDAARAVGGYDPSLVFSEDHHFWLRLALRDAPAHSRALVAVHRRHPSNRHGAMTAQADDATITALADDEPRFAARRPERLGVRLCEAAIEAAKARSPRRVVALAAGLAAEPARAEILRAAARHWRRRRTSHALALRIWRDRPDVRDWLGAIE
ncbi:MAG: glycosyltransferase family A protein [Solirubrobacteraceae bacterium]